MGNIESFTQFRQCVWPFSSATQHTFTKTRIRFHIHKNYLNCEKKCIEIDFISFDQVLYVHFFKKKVYFITVQNFWASRFENWSLNSNSQRFMFTWFKKKELCTLLIELSSCKDTISHLRWHYKTSSLQSEFKWHWKVFVSVINQ